MKILSLVYLLAAAQHHIGGDAAGAGSPDQEDSSGKEVAIYEDKEYVRDESKEIVEPIVYTNKDRFEKTCGQNERVFSLSFTTDKYGYETSFELRQVGGGIIGSGPGSNRNYADNSTYNLKYCVKIGQQYRLRMKDRAADGMCCNMGQGSYRFGIGGQTSFNSNKKRTFSKVAMHTFRVRAPASSQTNNSSPISGKNDGGSGCITVKARADRNPGELSWRILRNGNQVGASPSLRANSLVSKRVCLPAGQYTFEMKDKYGDGMCCGSGDGYFTILIDGKEVAGGSRFSFVKRITIQVNPGFERRMSARDRDWLTSHNTRRRKYHAQFGKSYVPLKWSPQMAAQAKRWATRLLSGCDSKGIEHEKGIAQGENLAKNRGSGSFGNMYPTDNILTRWVENEMNDGYPANAHLTQALWRSSKYLGCGEASRPFNGGRGTCRVQVCRYATAGNCNMKAYQASKGNNWIKPMMEEDSRCGPDCAPEGCY